MPSEPEFAQEHSQTARLRLVLMGTACGAVVIVLSKAWLVPLLHAFIAWAPCHSAFGIQGQTLLWYAVFVATPLQAAVLVAAIGGWRGYKILREGQFPLRNEKVYRPTRIRRGAPARRIAYLHLLAAVPLLALSIWGGFQADQLSRTIPPDPACSASRAG